MATVYIIDDQYVKDKFPSLATYNNKDILSVIMLEQESTLASDMTEELYDDLIANIIAGTVTGTDYEELLTLAQKYLLYLTIVGVYSFYKQTDGEDSREYNISNLYGKIKYAQKRLKDYISETAFDTTGDDFDTETYNYSPIYYSR